MLTEQLMNLELKRKIEPHHLVNTTIITIIETSQKCMLTLVSGHLKRIRVFV